MFIVATDIVIYTHSSLFYDIMTNQINKISTWLLHQKYKDLRHYVTNINELVVFTKHLALLYRTLTALILFYHINSIPATILDSPNTLYLKQFTTNSTCETNSYIKPEHFAKATKGWFPRTNRNQPLSPHRGDSHSARSRRNGQDRGRRVKDEQSRADHRSPRTEKNFSSTSSTRVRATIKTHDVEAVKRQGDTKESRTNSWQEGGRRV